MIIEIAREEGQYGPHLALFEAVGRIAPVVLGRSLPLNGAGACGAALADIGIPLGLLRGVVLLARCAGLLGHLAEEMRNPDRERHLPHRRVTRRVRRTAVLTQPATSVRARAACPSGVSRPCAAASGFRSVPAAEVDIRRPRTCGAYRVTREVRQPVAHSGPS